MSREKIGRNKRIYEYWKKGISYRKIGKMYGIKESTVFDIVKREAAKLSTCNR